LVYPYFVPQNDNSIFRFPPLGLGYLASALKLHGFDVELVDCTFQTKQRALSQIQQSDAQIVGFYSMFSMKKTTVEMARQIRKPGVLLLAGGPLPTLDPDGFLDDFDLVATGEGEETIVELASCVEKGLPISGVKGIGYRDAGKIRFTAPRDLIEDLDSVAFPAREIFDNEAYKRYYAKRFGYTTSPLITSRGCPFSCGFCSRPVFGSSFRRRSPENIVDEVAQIEGFGYERVWFADDCFTLNSGHLRRVCSLLVERGIDLGWECLSRVDTLNVEMALAMKRAGCIRVFFGIESGNDGVLAAMNKQITAAQARKAVYAAKQVGLKVGAFFIVGYPGETDKTVLDTVRFASALPLDYLSFTLPYPIPGTELYDMVKDRGGIEVDNWEEPKNWSLIRHKLLYGSNFSERKLKFAIGKAHAQFYGRRILGERAYRLIGEPFEVLSDQAFKFM
jgi:anaerobic magnesium-protoporphyrin IX monomethyl ester cyclase